MTLKQPLSYFKHKNDKLVSFFLLGLSSINFHTHNFIYLAMYIYFFFSIVFILSKFPFT